MEAMQTEASAHGDEACCGLIPRPVTGREPGGNPRPVLGAAVLAHLALALDPGDTDSG